MNLKPYPKYKDSGIEWLGEIPIDWDLLKLKWISKKITSGGTPNRGYELYYDGNIPWITTGELNDDYIYDANEYITYEGLINSSAKVFKAGTVLIAMYGATVGKLGILNIDASTNQACCAIILSEKIESKYLFYLLMSARQHLISQGYGGGQPNISQDIVKNVFVPVINRKHQTAIATFLDQKTVKIDELIKKNEKLIDLLKEYRQALISHTVTKGLDPNAKMKDSGIEWIGKIPEGWEIKRLKWIARLEYGSSLSEEAREDGSIPVFGSNGIVGEHSKSITGKPAIIIGRKGSYGKVSYSEVPCFPIDTTYYIDSSLTKENIRWLYYLLSSINLDEVTFDTGVPGLSREFAYSKIIPLPTFPEQTTIANYLDHQTARIDEAIHKIQSQIATLKEYRTALISAAVTGKIDVHGSN